MILTKKQKGFVIKIINAFVALSFFAFLPGVANAISGERLYNKRCGNCHPLEPGVSNIGPSLHAIIGKPAGREKSFSGYGGLKGADFIWNEEFLDSFLYDPKYFLGKLTPMMSRVKKAKERKAIIEFLKRQN